VEAKDQAGKVVRTIALMDEPSKEVEIPLPFVPKQVLIDPLGENLMKIVDR